MKLKYYLRGLGIGIIFTTFILMISFAFRKEELSDEEIIARAFELGMVMQEEDSESEKPVTEATEQTEATEMAENTQQTEDTGEPDTSDITQEPDSELAREPQEVPQQGEIYELAVNRGDVCRTLCEKLADNGVVDDAEALRKYLFQIGYASSISVGTYQIPYGLTYEEIAQVLQAGPMEKMEEGQ